MPLANYLKQNEKVIMVVLLVVIAPTFAFSGLVYYLMEDRSGTTYFYVGDERVSALEYQRLRSQLGDYLSISSMTHMQGNPWQRAPRQVDSNSVERFVLLQKEARRLNMSVSDKELNDYVVDHAKRLIAWHEVYNELSGIPSQDFRKKFDDKLRSLVFTHEAYRKVLADEDFLGMKISVRNFENMLATNLLVQKLTSAIQSSVVVADSEVYDRFKLENELRSFDFVGLPTARFREEAATKITDEFKLTTFESNKSVFRIPPRVKLSAAVLVRNRILVDDAEIQQRYDADKDTLYLVEVPEGAPPPAEKQYKPLPEVREFVKESVARSKERTITLAALEKAKTLAAAKAAGGADYTWQEVYGESFPLVTPIETDAFSAQMAKDNQVPVEIQSPNLSDALNSMLKVGDLCLRETFNNTGSYLYRLTERLDAEDAKYEAVDQVKLLELALTDKALELCLDYLKTKKELIDKAEAGLTLEAWAQAEGAELITTEPLAKNDMSKLKVGDKPLLAAGPLLREVFTIPAIGSVGAPVAATVTKDFCYLSRLKGKHDPDSSMFDEPRRRRALDALKRERRQDSINAYLVDLLKRYEVRYPVSADTAAPG
ncbi:MAG: SurA N-terminal domain-containing protein [Planctomycetota bacterium]